MYIYIQKQIYISKSEIWIQLHDVSEDVSYVLRQTLLMQMYHNPKLNALSTLFMNLFHHPILTQSYSMTTRFMTFQ